MKLLFKMVILLIYIEIIQFRTTQKNQSFSISYKKITRILLIIIMIIITQARTTQSILLCLFQMKNNLLKTKLQIPRTKRKNHQQLTSNQNHLTNNLHFNKINNKAVISIQKTNLIFTTMTIILTPVDTPTTDTISAHNHEKTIDFSSVKRT